MKGYTMFPPGKSRNGFVLLAIVIAIAILLLLYMADISSFLNKTNSSSERSPDLPWFEENRLQQTKLPAPPQPVINEPLTLTGDVFSDKQSRGKITLNLETDGSATGSWDTEYSYPPNKYLITAKFAGRVDPTKVFTREKTTDSSLLYIFTKGTYNQTMTNIESNIESVTKGVIYATAWLDPNYSATGTITMTSDQTWHISYSFAASQ
jgi:hypothetical protein